MGNILFLINPESVARTAGCCPCRKSWYRCSTGYLACFFLGDQTGLGLLRIVNKNCSKCYPNTCQIYSVHEGVVKNHITPTISVLYYTCTEVTPIKGFLKSPIGDFSQAQSLHQKSRSPTLGHPTKPMEV